MKLSILLLVFVVVISSSHAGPWTRKQGTGFVQLGFSTIGYNKIYDDDSKKMSLPVDVRDHVLQLFAEYGVTDKITVAAMVPVKLLSYKGSIGSASVKSSRSGISDIDLAVKQNWVNTGSTVLSGEVLFGLPTGSTSSSKGLYLGDGEFNVTARVLAGKSFYPAPAYVSGSLGFNFRTNDFSHDVPFELEGGYGFMDGRLYLILLISGRESLSNKPLLGPNATSADMSAAALGVLGNNREYLAVIPKLFFSVDDHWRVSVSFATATHGRNVAGGFVFAGAVAYAF